tara:strand:- start:53 stop:292 length:240 start_codon:yes stop_codon:yes gene_type:complete
MLTYIIYIVVFLILAYVIIIAFNAINRGIEAKHNNKSIIEEKMETKKNLVEEINQIKKLHNEGVLNDEEFKKAKDKVLN